MYLFKYMRFDHVLILKKLPTTLEIRYLVVKTRNVFCLDHDLVPQTPSPDLRSQPHSVVEEDSEYLLAC